MEFRFTDEQLALADKVRAFAADQVAPTAREHDRTGRFPPALVAELGRAGLFGLGVPEEYGGSGHGAVAVGIALEELSKADSTVGMLVLNAALIGGIIERNGTPRQCAEWLPAIAAGEATVALCLTEPEHGTDAANIELRAEPDGDGWSLTGTKTSIMLGDFATHGLVFARTGEPGARGITAFYTRLDRSEVERERLTDLGHRAGGRATLRFTSCRVGRDELVGDLGSGFSGVMRGFDYSRALIAIMAVASAGVCVDEALEYARQRSSFGAPLGTHQGVSFPLVEQCTQLHAARLLAYEALWRKDAGLDHRSEANMVKWWAPKVGMAAANQALLTLGHRGWSTAHPLERRLRDIIGLQIADGTENAAKLAVARQLLGREYAP